jgi:succinyl-diaminopimelate desuccinylase
MFSKVEQKGILRLRVIARGNAAHSSRPWLGDNAILRLTNAYADLLNHYPMPQSEDDWRISITLSELTGGISPNMVPHHAEGVLDIRYPFTNIDAGKQVFAEINAILSRHQLETRIISLSNGYHMDPDSLYPQRMQNVAKEILGKPLPTVREAGASDARHFAPEQVPVLIFQPECAGWHGEVEWVDLDSLATFRTMCLAYTRAILGRERISSKSNSHTTSGTVEMVAATPRKTVRKRA